MKKARPVEVLIELLDDEGVAGHAVAALARLKAPETASDSQLSFPDLRPSIGMRARWAPGPKPHLGGSA